MRQQWFARLADGEMVIDTPGWVDVIHRPDPAVDEPATMRPPLPSITSPLLTPDHAPALGWHR